MVSLTFGAGYPPVRHGIGSAIYTRIVLDKAGSVDEALQIYKKAAYVTPNNVMIADAQGKAVVIEHSAGKHSIRKADGNILVCANSYRSPQMRDQQKIKNPTTAWREKVVQSQEGDFSTPGGMMDFLTSDFPNGLYEPYFSWGLGTLWSVVYCPVTREIYLAIGEKGVSRREIKFNLADPGSLKGLPISLKTDLKDVNLRSRLPQYIRATR